MKMKNVITIMLLSLCVLSALSGCSSSRSGGVNEISISLDGITEITVSYDEETVTFFETDGEEIIIKENMSEYKSRYCADVERKGNGVKISEGGKPLFKSGFVRYIEVYLPCDYNEILTVTSTDGNIDITNMDLYLKSFKADCTSGNVKIGNAEAQNIKLSVTHGNLYAVSLKAEHIAINTTDAGFYCDTLDGTVDYTTTHGDAVINSAVGAGSYKNSNSGSLGVKYVDVEGNLSFYNKNGDSSVVLPEDWQFYFVSTVKNGSVNAAFPIKGNVTDGRTVRGTVGEKPTVTVEAETVNGNIEVRYEA